ncbi:pentapeptide repeat-containing protein [Pseudalkalibacillus decolorationis]|uniref:pentapeptide repeat-containing protein n=1 Tax=Pseudalkalibacillus decolorationis TaxID=163879 RepID=UPI002149210B|nr:pentapeptide repeat-containing protein [Pseudalkalibacillus decolorationis]
MTVSTKLQSPKVPAELSPISLEEEIHHERYFQMGIVNDCEITGESIEKLCFEKVVFKNVTFQDVSFRFNDLTDVVFDKCDLSNADFGDAIVHRVEMKECKMLGMNLSGSTLRNVLFDECIGKLAAFGYSDCKNVKFQASYLCNADFYEAKFKNVAFDQCDLNEANLSGTILKGIDLSTCSFEKLTISIEKLEGCIISNEQAIGFAKALGLVIKEE